MENSLEAVGIAGDWHYNTSHALQVLEQFKGLGLSHIFQLGDFGLWGSLLEHSHDKFRWRIQERLERNEQLLFVTLGNHEKYPLLNSFNRHQEGPWRGFLYEPKAPRILYFTRGQSLILSGVNFLSIGGAASIDYKFRKEGKSIWKEELISAQDVRNTITEANRLGRVDVLLAHDVFSSAPIFGTHRQSDKWDYEEKLYAQTSRDALEKIAQAVVPELWLHGHYHAPIATTVAFEPTKKTHGGKIKTFCLARDEEPQATGVLWLKPLQFEYLPNLKP